MWYTIDISTYDAYKCWKHKRVTPCIRLQKVSVSVYYKIYLNYKIIVIFTRTSGDQGYWSVQPWSENNKDAA